MDANQRPVRLAVGVVGAGRVGAVLGAAFRAAGHEVVATSAVSEASRTRAADLLPGVPVVEIEDVVAASDLVLLTVPDDALATLIAGLTSVEAWRPGQLVAHTSGRHGIAVFGAALETGLITPLALHPAMTFTGTTVDLDRLVDACFGVTATPAARVIAEALVVELGAEPVWIAEADRAAYHLALAHGANHLVTLIGQSLQVLRDIGVEAPGRLLGPLTRAALDNALRQGDAALTGPVARGDLGTVDLHLRTAADLSPDLRPAYLAMARATLERARRDGRLRPALADPLAAALEETP